MLKGLYRLRLGGWVCVGTVGLLLVSAVFVGAEERVEKATVELWPGDALAAVSGETVHLPVAVSTSTPLAGVQLRLSFDPAKMVPGKPELTDRSADMTVAYNAQDGELTVIVYSASGKVISAGEGPVVSVPFKVADFGPWTSDLGLKFEEVILASPEAEAIPVTVKPASVSLGVRTPTHYGLTQNYPNPFNPVTSIQYSVVSPVHTTLKIYNILGQEVRTLVNEVMEPGFHSVNWDGRDSQGAEVASGVYFYRLVAGDFSNTKRMLLLK